MSNEQITANLLDGLAAQVLAADPSNREGIVEIGAALEKARTGEEGLGDDVQDALDIVLGVLEAIYEGNIADTPAAMDAMEAVATVLAAGAQRLREPDDSGVDIGKLAEGLGSILTVVADGSATESDKASPSAEPQADQEQAVAEQAERDDAPDSRECLEDHAANSPEAGGCEDSSGAADQQAVTEEASPARLPEDTDFDLLGEFAVECLDHISAAEAALLDLENNPTDAEPVNTIFRAFHTIKGTSGFLGLDRVQRVAHLAENLLDRARDGEIRVVGGYADLALNSCDALRTMIEGLEGVQPGEPLVLPDNYDALLEQLSDPEAAGVDEEADSEPLRTGDILVGKGQAERSQVEQAVATQGDRPIGQVLVEKGVATPSAVAGALRTQNKMRGKSNDVTVRVGTDRLDSLIEAVGELVITQSMVAQDPAVTDGSRPQLARNVSHADKIVRKLQDVSMSLRMVPLKATFGKMARLVRDLSHKAGKKVRFITEGEDTEIDRNMVEVLNDPLVHMMRNAVDHGVETPEKRIAAGKDPMGTIRLRAYNSAGNVVIDLADDGNGIDRDRVVAKATERGLIQPGEVLSDAEAFGLIFRAGFSTAEKVTDISGRGVGMDVVRSGIESLRGRVDVTSQPGVGSTFTIRLPLTMAIADAMLVRVAGNRYLLPIVSIEQSFRPDAGQLSTVAGGRGEVVNVRGELLPLFRLYDIFKLSGANTNPLEALLIIIEGEGERYALMVDELLGQQQVVIKTLGHAFGQVPGVSGGAILGDGRVGLILDAAGILKLAQTKANEGKVAAMAA